MSEERCKSCLLYGPCAYDPCLRHLLTTIACGSSSLLSHPKLHPLRDGRINLKDQEWIYR